MATDLVVIDFARYACVWFNCFRSQEFHRRPKAEAEIAPGVADAGDIY